MAKTNRYLVYRDGIAALEVTNVNSPKAAIKYAKDYFALGKKNVSKDEWKVFVNAKWTARKVI
jgi:hypothetical protein